MRTPLHQPGSGYHPYHARIAKPDLTNLAPLPDPARQPRFLQHTDPIRECSVCHTGYRFVVAVHCPVPNCQGTLS